MLVTNTFQTEDPEARLAGLSAIHRRCLMLLRAMRTDGGMQ